MGHGSESVGGEESPPEAQWIRETAARCAFYDAGGLRRHYGYRPQTGSIKGGATAAYQGVFLQAFNGMI